MSIRVGFGYDIHRFSDERELILGGIRIPSDKGLLGHSDADILLHAIMDAMLGALNLRDIGFHFPDTSEEYKGADSTVLFKKVKELCSDKGWSLGNVDATLVMEQPKIKPHAERICENIAKLIDAERDIISLKATTSEKMGFVGKGMGAKAYAVVLMQKNG